MGLQGRSPKSHFLSGAAQDAKMLKNLFILALVTIPFSAIPGFQLLGELQHEVSTYVFLLAFLFCVPSFLPSLQTRTTPPVYLVPKVMLAALAIIALSFLANFSSILDDHFRDRAGVEKFFSCVAVVMYGFFLTYLSYFLAKYEWQDLIIRPVAISVVICVVFSLFEVLSWWNPTIGDFYSVLSAFVHAGFGWENVGPRLRSVSFEPAAFANYAGFAWPWLFAGYASRQGTRRLVYFVLWMILTAMMILSSTRTGIIMLGGNVVLLLMLRYVYLPPKQNAALIGHIAFWPVLGLLLIFGILLTRHFDDLINAVVSGESISNLSRLASNTAAFNMFWDYPFFGVGFGQYGFHISSYMPSWGYYSWEIVSWISGPDAAKWPPIFSVYARLAAELGALGVIAWTVFWLWLARKLWQATLLYQKIEGTLPYPAYPLIMSCFCVLFGGIPSDSLRPPMIWITLGLSCYYLQELRMNLAGTKIMALDRENPTP